MTASQIFSNIKKFWYDYIKNNIFKDDKEIKINSSSNLKNDINKNEIYEIKLDEKLKSLILLSINQEKDYSISTFNNNKKGYKVCLNLNILFIYI